jgi:hypothetical protein
MSELSQFFKLTGFAFALVLLAIGIVKLFPHPS